MILVLRGVIQVTLSLKNARIRALCEASRL
jgi:hypothetical protein